MEIEYPYTRKMLLEKLNLKNKATITRLEKKFLTLNQHYIVCVENNHAVMYYSEEALHILLQRPTKRGGDKKSAEYLTSKQSK
jgi:hypothetical protein